MNNEQQSAAFEAWWVKEGQHCRAGGGDYEKTFAYRAFLAAIELDRQSRGEPVADCWSKNDGDSWGEHPADADFVDGLKVGDEYELQASVGSWTERFRVTKAPDDTSDDYEVEPVSIRTAPQPAEPVKGPSVGEIMRLVEAYVDARTPDRSRYATNEAAAQAARQIRKDIRALLARYGNAAQPANPTVKDSLTTAEPVNGPTDEAIEDFLSPRTTPEGRIPMIGTIRAALSHFAAPVAAQPAEPVKGPSVPDHLIERLRKHCEDKANTAFSRSTMREALHYLTTPPAYKEQS